MKFKSVAPSPQNIEPLMIGIINILLITEITDTLPKKRIDTGTVKRIDITEGNTLSFTNLDRLNFSKQLGKNINPVVDKNEKRKPISYIRNGLKSISNVIQRSNDENLLQYLPINKAKKYILLIVEALMREAEKPENIEKSNIPNTFKIFTNLPLIRLNITSIPLATSATLYPEAAITCDTPVFLKASLKPSVNTLLLPNIIPIKSELSGSGIALSTTLSNEYLISSGLLPPFLHSYSKTSNIEYIPFLKRYLL